MQKGRRHIRLSRAAVSSTVVNRSLRICSSCARFASPSLLFPGPSFGLGVLCGVVVSRSSIVQNTQISWFESNDQSAGRAANIYRVHLHNTLAIHTALQTFPIALRQALPTYPTLSLCSRLASTFGIQIFLYVCCRSQHTVEMIHSHFSRYQLSLQQHWTRRMISCQFWAKTVQGIHRCKSSQQVRCG